MRTAKHEKFSTPWSSQATQQVLTGRTEQTVFNEKVAVMLVAADIPVHKPSFPAFCDFLESECGRKIPDESTTRMSYISQLEERTMDTIRESCGEIFVSSNRRNN